ncbi:MAG TPA: hypothetical protein VJA21_30220 [Verrucomicrobiae bacterium]
MLSLAFTARAGWIWVEGEKPTVNKMNRHPWWYDQVKKEQFSGGDFISNFEKDKAGEADYAFDASQDGGYDFWVRANPLMSKLSFSLNDGPETAIDLNREKRGEVNVAADNKPDLRFIAWCKVGNVALRKGQNTIRFRMTSENNHHGYLDCFVFSNEPFQPRGLLKPDQLAAESATAAADQKGWFPFDPKPDSFGPDSAIDLRFLNEKFAGEHGYIGVKAGEFIHTSTGEPLRFWGVNGPPHELKPPELRQCARMLAKHGVNLVRIHGGYFEQSGEVNTNRVKQAFEIVAAMKAEGIYSHLSIYFPLWLTPKPNTPWLDGYDGKTHPFAALLFNPAFQAKYRNWWTALLTTPNPATGKTLAEEPAVAGLEIQNEDSFFFWTFSEQNIPDPQLRTLEKMFGDWAAKKYGSAAAALTKWNKQGVKRDAPDEGRLGFRPLWSIFNEKSLRDRDTAGFLYELQTRFYTDTYAFLRKLGFKGVITASNWATASPEVFGPLEKLSYTSCDFLDRHGYFSCNHKGESAEWSVRPGHTYADRSGLRFDPEQPGKSRQFVHPAMDPHYDGKPSMISETTWNRPNRFRSEAPLYFAVYGALQHSDALVHFALDGKDWAVKPGFWMQPWTLMSPSMVGQFPAAALIYRRGLVSTGSVLAEINLSRDALFQLQGTPLPQDAALDELRLKDIPTAAEGKPGTRIDPLVHYAGRTDVRFVDGPGSVQLKDLGPLIDHTAQTVTSSSGELKLDYGKGILTIDSARAQGVSGLLKTVGRFETKDLSLASDLELGHIILVPLDGQPLATSSKMLLQVMSEERSSEFQTEALAEGLKRISNIGVDPWTVKELRGTVTLRRADARQLKVTALDFNGYPAGTAGTADSIKLQPTTLYYLLSAQP